MQNFEDGNFSLQGAIADLNDDLNKLATRSEMWDVIQAKLEHHVKTLGKVRSGESDAALLIPPFQLVAVGFSSLTLF